MFNLFKKKKRESLPAEMPGVIDPHEDLSYVSEVSTDEEGKGTMHQPAGAKFPLRGIPKGIHLKMTEIGKAMIDKLITRIAKTFPEPNPNRCCKSTRELIRVFDLLIEAEKLTGMKIKWRKIKKVICFLWENDMAYRYRGQWLMERLNKDEVKLQEDDKYYFRVKNFRVDYEEEWKECLKKYPQIKDRMQEFKDFVSDEEHERTRNAFTLEQLAEQFLKVGDK